MHLRRNKLSRYLPGTVALIVLAVLAAGFIFIASKTSRFFPTTAHASGTALTGYAWSDNIGWISFSGTATDGSAYGVTVGSGGALSGYAWSDNIGWINFGANSCGAQATMTAGALSGFAQAASNGGGWDGCISLSGASPAYGITLSGSTFTGYAWGSDVVGWVSFSGTATDGSPYSVVYGGAGSPTCTLSVAPNPAATGSSITLNYTTTGSPAGGEIKDASDNPITWTATNSSGGVAATAPATPETYTYKMVATSTSGSGSGQTTPALTAATDVCQNIASLQSSWSDPNGYISGGNCLCNSGYVLSGLSCIVSVPAITKTNFSGPTRVRSGNTATLSYTVASPPASCSITGSNGFSTTVSPVDGVQGSVATNAITGATKFTITCGSVSASVNVGIVPTYQEQ